MKHDRLICLLLLGWLLAGYGYAQIRGGAETAQFEPGDHVLYQEDLSGTPIGAQVEGWEIVRGSYEVAEFLDKRWFRPLERDTRMLRPLPFPQDFSVEFTTYLSAEAGARLKVFLYTARDLERERMGPDGPAQVYLIVGRGYHPDHDFVHLRVYDPAQRRYQDVVSPGSYKFTPNQPHQVALQVRGGQLQLFVDGTRVALTPFRPEAPLVAIGFIFDAGSGHELPYKDRPALVDGLRIAGYSRPVGRATGGVFLYWALPGAQQDQPQLFAQSQTFNGSWGLESVGGERRTLEGTFVVIDLPANPFAPGEVRVRAGGQAWNDFVQRLKQELEVVRQQGGGLVIVGDGGDGRTERERRLLANQRALAFAAWLAQQGIGNPQHLLSIVVENSGYESIYFIAENGGYESIYSLRLERKQ
ncbi:hypothetical protein [Rhodothermus marinus]|uniref:Uncharacterized protein n=1 Tax=Rhodothermus marinus (strain ATCC 43812 / DSM 4252 / R-10) TaxID=518766 RepID=D0MFM0_RHOM4|nr:hypothetical protein [Rhodothermus marinus]ACY47547.1 hypothetical protein Rmar_0648 [Rhodothermus marinus DSM 4252]